MKNSRKFVIICAGITSLFFAGTILGSYLPESKTLYTMITVAAVATVALIYFGFTGNEVEKKVVETTKKPPQKKEKKVADNNDFIDISSGR